ncbi:MAG: ParB/RepB/Spo0J family partition protein [Pirellulales bacterium]
MNHTEPGDRFEYRSPTELTVDVNIRDRIDEDALLGLMTSLTAVGMLLPIRVRLVKGLYVVIDGTRRLMAALRLGWEKVPVVIDVDELTDVEIVQRQLIANCQRENLSPLEEAAAIRSLMNITQCNATEAARKIGKKPSDITRRLALLELPAAILAWVSDGSIPASCAYELSRIKDPIKQAELAGLVKEGKLTRDELVGRKKLKGPKPVSPTKEKSSNNRRATASLDAQRSITVCGPELDLESFIAWLEELLSKARRERTRGVALSTFVKVLNDQAKKVN